MTDTLNTAEILDDGMNCLIEHIGILKTEIFISTLLTERFDYTKWHQKFADRTGPKELDALVRQAEEVSPYQGDPSTIL